jgi:hypothetical protein
VAIADPIVEIFNNKLRAGGSWRNGDFGGVCADFHQILRPGSIWI